MRTPVVVDAAAQGVGDGVGLLGDLLRHEAGPAALVAGRGVPRHLELLGLDGVAVEVGDGDGVGGDRDDLVLADGHGAAGVLDEGRDIRPQEVLAVTEADHERRVAARADDEAGLVLVQGEQGERALEAATTVAGRRRRRSPAARYSRPSSTAATSVSVSLSKV